MSLNLWTLGNIKTKIRYLIGAKNDKSFTNIMLLNYINRYYTLIFPLEVQPLELQTWFSFDTVDGTDEYNLWSQTDTTSGQTFEDGYLTLSKPITADGYNVRLWMNPEEFYAKWPAITTYEESRPQDVLYYDQSLIFRAPPDDAYTMYFASIKKPESLSDDTDYPTQEEWGPTIASGASLEALEDMQNSERAAEVMQIHERNKNILMRKVHNQYSEYRSIPSF